MDELTTGQILDKILKYCLINKNDFFNENVLIKNLLPELNKDEITILLDKIKNSPRNVADARIGRDISSIQANGLTEKFLEQGGFTEIEKQEKLKEQKIKEREDLEFDLAKSNLESNKLNKEIAKKNAKNEKSNRFTTWINITIGLINAGLLIWQILKD